MTFTGKGSRHRRSDWNKYRNNYDTIFKKKKYPEWICKECGNSHGKRPEGNPYGATWHIDICGICKNTTECTEPRDFGHLREGWDK